VKGNTSITNTLATGTTTLTNAANNLNGTLALNLAGGTAAITTANGIDLAASNLANTVVQLTTTGTGRTGKQLDTTADGTGMLLATPVTTNVAIVQSGAITQGATGTLTITAPTTSKVLLNSQANTLNGQISINAATGALDAVEIQSTKVNIGTLGIYANTVTIKADSVTSPTATSIIKIVQNPVNNYATNALFFIDYLSGAGNATFGLAGTGSGIKVDMQNGVLPVFYKNRTNAVYLEGPTLYKPLYDYADDPTARLVMYNNQVTDSPTTRSALNAALSPLRDAIKDALSSGFSKENLRKQLEQGVVLETGLARPGIDKIGGISGAAQQCEASTPDLGCAGAP
jgi:hypothetical protein